MRVEGLDLIRKRQERSIGIGTAWAWWTGELAEIAGSLAKLLRLGPRRVREVPLAPEYGDGGKAVAKERPSRPLVLILDEQDCFIRRMTVPRSALHHLDNILELEVGRVTPFAPQDVLSGWYELPGESGDGEATIAHVIARKEMAWPVIEELHGLGQRIAGVRLKRASGQAIDLRLKLGLPEPAGVRRLRRLAAGLASAGAALAFVAAGLILSRQADEIGLLDERLQQAQLEAKKIRDAVDAIESASERIAALRDAKLTAPSPLAVWSELTRLLPDSVWLAGLAINQSTVTIDGNAQSAESLIALLDGSPMFENVAFTGPVTKLPGGRLDRFAISLALSKPATLAASQ